MAVNGWLKSLDLDDQATWPTREESVFLDAALIQWNDPHGQGGVLGKELAAWQAGAVPTSRFPRAASA
jgi:hypothetical protein